MSKLQRLWRGNSAVVHLLIWAFFVGVAWAGVAAQAVRIDQLENKTTIVVDKVNDVSGDIRQIKESVEWIKDSLRRR